MAANLSILIIRGVLRFRTRSGDMLTLSGPILAGTNVCCVNEIRFLLTARFYGVFFYRAQDRCHVYAVRQARKCMRVTMVVRVR